MAEALTLHVALLCLLALLQLHLPSCAAANVSLAVNTAVTPHRVSRDLWGVFFEELNHAGEGGLYSQRLQNTNFEVKVRPQTARRTSHTAHRVHAPRTNFALLTPLSPLHTVRRRLLDGPPFPLPA